MPTRLAFLNVALALRLVTSQAGHADAVRVFAAPVERSRPVGSTGRPSAFEAGDERAVYVNSHGLFAVPVPKDVLAADDIQTTASAGCRLTRFRFEVTGQVDPAGPDGAYSVTFGFYDDCPSAGGAVIPGTQGEVQVLDAGRRMIEFALPPEVVVPRPDYFWIGARFSRDNCGFIIGAPALTGFSEDRFDTNGAGCVSTAGGFPAQPHASINAEVFADGACPAAFPAYHNVGLGGLDLTEGPGILMAEDLELGVTACQMIAYEVGVRNAGSYQFDLREGGLLPGEVITGTQRGFEKTTGGASLLRFTFDPPVAIPQDVWLTFLGDSFDARWVLTDRDAAIGHTGPGYAKIRGISTWQPVFPQGLFIGFNVRIVCAGEAPRGACCDMFVTECRGGPDDGIVCRSTDDCGFPGRCEPDCREVPLLNCAYPPRGSGLKPEWREGAACEPDPFPHPCGVAACCTPADTCEILTQNECEAVPPAELVRDWQRGTYCGDQGQRCGFNACMQQEGNCARDRPGRGCANETCCANVCGADPWCCRVQWDTICIRRYMEACPGLRPVNGVCEAAEGFDLQAGKAAVGSAVVSNRLEPTIVTDAGFSCHADSPGARGAGDVWFKFTATDMSARVQTCATLRPANDTLLAIYRAGDPTDPITACDTLLEIGCSDDVTACGSGYGSALCAEGLTAGDTYYIQVASATAAGRGIIRVDLESPCPATSAEGPAGYDASIAWRPSGQLKDGPVDEDARGAIVRAAPEPVLGHLEIPDDPFVPAPPGAAAATAARGGIVVRDGFVSVQVNVDAIGNNIPGDAANEPSIAVDPTDPSRMVIGWRQFNTVQSNFRQAGWGYSHDGGQSWTFPGVIQPGVFRSDPVLDSDAEGNFYYYSLQEDFDCDLFKSVDGGVTWSAGVAAHGGDKAWFAADRTLNASRGNLYAAWNKAYSCCNGDFTRSVDGGASFLTPIEAPGSPIWGTVAVAQDGAVFISDNDGLVVRSSSAGNPLQVPTFDLVRSVDLGGSLRAGQAPNPEGLAGQMWVAVEPPGGRNPDNVYLLGSVSPGGATPTQVMFARSRDRGATWSEAVRVNDDSPFNGAWHWFGTMSVAPTGRIDVEWNDTRNSGLANVSELFYSYSVDQGESWSANVAVSPAFNSYVGWPRQNKLGDYYDAVSDELGVNVAYAATFNGEQDVYFLRVEPFIDCDGDGVYDPKEVRNGLAPDCNANLIPDSCERDVDGDGTIDACDKDIDGDGILNGLDVCPLQFVGGRVDGGGRPLSDTDADCTIDGADFWRFVNCLEGGRPGAAAPTEACGRAFDVDGDLEVRLSDFAMLQNVLHSPLP